MTEPANRLVVDAHGDVRIDGAQLNARMQRLAGRYELLADVPGLLVFRADSVPERQRARVLMAGEIVNRMTVMEILNIIAQANWRGDLHIVEADALRVLSFDQGALKAARSDAVDDRLGEVMFRNALVDRAQLDELVRTQPPGKRFGEHCVERGLVDAAKLFEQLQKQAEAIFYAGMLVADGHYAFVLPAEGETDTRATTFHLPIHGLLMEGVQRIDEMALFRERVPSSELCPRPVAGAPERKLDENAKLVLSLADGRQTIEDLARVTGLGEFLTTKAVYHLVQGKQVTLSSARRVRPEQVVALVGRFNDVMQDIFIAVATYGGLAQSRATIDAWIAGSGYAPIFGPGVDDFGLLDPEVVAEAMAHVEVEHPLENLHQLLHELAAFALFSATTSLPRDQELALARDVNARLKSIRLA